MGKELREYCVYSLLSKAIVVLAPMMNLTERHSLRAPHECPSPTYPPPFPQKRLEHLTGLDAEYPPQLGGGRRGSRIGREVRGVVPD